MSTRNRKLEAESKRLKLEIQNLRAHLMELRVSNESPKEGAIGWMVSAFVPESAVSYLRAHPESVAEYTRLVAEALVSNAVKKVLRLSKCGKIQALIFEPVTRLDQKVVRTRPWFEADTERQASIGYREAKQLSEKTDCIFTG